jgi:hypothetical protein
MNKKRINELGAKIPKSNPYKEPKRPSKPLTPKKPDNPWDKGGWEEPEEVPTEKRKAYDPNNWKNESRNMNKKIIRLTESDLHRIVKESVQRILAENGENEGLFDFFKKKKQPQQQPKQPQMPRGVYKDLDGATFGLTSNSRVKVCVLKTSIGTLYVHPHTTERVGIDGVISQLRKSGVRVSSYNEQVVDNPNWNGLTYRTDGHTGEKGYGGSTYGASHAGEDYLGIGHSAYDDLAR